MTYEGLVDELMGIKNGYVELDPAVAGIENAPAGRQIKHPLNSNDTLFADVRDLNFGVLQVIDTPHGLQLIDTPHGLQLHAMRRIPAAAIGC